MGSEFLCPEWKLVDDEGETVATIRADSSQEARLKFMQAALKGSRVKLVEIPELAVWHLLSADYAVVASVTATDAREAKGLLKLFGLEGAWLRRAS